MDFKEAYPDRCSTVGSAVKAGDADTLSKLIDKGCRVNISDNRGWFPVHEAAAAGNVNCLKLLLNHDSTEIDGRTFEGETSVFLAANAGHSETLEVLLKAGANSTLPNNEHATPLFEACDQNHEKCVDLLLECKTTDVNAVDMSEQSPLHAAAWGGNQAILVKLLKAGGEVDSEDVDGMTPTFVAAQYGNTQCLKMLVEAGGKVNTQIFDGATALHIAAQEGHTDCIKYLLDSGADPNLLTEDAYKAIHFAAEKNRLESLKLLLPVTQLEYKRGVNGWTPLHCTTLNDNVEAAELILSYGVDVNTGFIHRHKKLPKKFDVKSPLRFSYDSKSRKLFTFLLSKGARLHCEEDGFGGCYLKDVFFATGTRKGRDDISEMNRLFSYGLKMECKCTKVIRFYQKVADFASLHMYKYLLDCGLKPQLNCYSSCVCMFDLRGYDTSYLQRSISLAVCYAHQVNQVCPCSVQLINCLPYWPHIKQFLEVPGRLQHLCRLAIREILRPKGLQHIKEFVDKMEITNVMKRYLLYEDDLTNVITNRI
ncbi:uncharacterized protein [Antedon mediterranea]|uniref:uncharacterized protein n=1 Tax=Antedon mediterranea TaxID=105859 RepID=UPI003AF44B49